MFIRFALIAAAVALAVAGCHAKKGQRHAKGIATHSRMVAQQPPASQPVPLRGPVSWGATTKSAHHLPPTPPPTASAPYRLDSGDRLRVVVFGQENLSRPYTVDGGGFISMPLIGAVKSRGSTTFELEDRIASKLRSKYVKDPKVTVEVQNYRPFFILGEVRRPGQFPYVSGMTVRTAVAIAGGYTERARESKVKLTRGKNGHEQTLKVSGSHPIRPGDTIYVMERIF
ncbi:MAG: polysaccharide export protein [Hyphomicrobiales bacterium]|nr:polysaccharide export protein [Hyphomicrobiales bacterium]